MAEDVYLIDPAVSSHLNGSAHRFQYEELIKARRPVVMIPGSEWQQPCRGGRNETFVAFSPIGQKGTVHTIAKRFLITREELRARQKAKVPTKNPEERITGRRQGS